MQDLLGAAAPFCLMPMSPAARSVSLALPLPSPQSENTIRKSGKHINYKFGTCLVSVALNQSARRDVTNYQGIQLGVPSTIWKSCLLRPVIDSNAIRKSTKRAVSLQLLHVPQHQHRPCGKWICGHWQLDNDPPVFLVPFMQDPICGLVSTSSDLLQKNVGWGGATYICVFCWSAQHHVGVAQN